jgi:hypothetical protein
MTMKEQVQRAAEPGLTITFARLLWARLRLWWQTRHARAASKHVSPITLQQGVGTTDGGSTALFSSLCSAIAIAAAGGSTGLLMMRSVLLISCLALAVALTAAWDTFISYEVFRLFEFVL